MKSLQALISLAILVLLTAITDFLYLFQGTSQSIEVLYSSLGILTLNSLLIAFYITIFILPIYVIFKNWDIVNAQFRWAAFIYVFLYLLGFFIPFVKLNYLYGVPYLSFEVVAALAATLLVIGVFSVAVVFYDRNWFQFYILPIVLLTLSSLVIILPWSYGYSLPRQKSASTVSKKPNVVYLNIDTLHAGHLPMYGYNRETSPHLKEFAENGVLFKKAFSAAPWTRPSVATLFTGLHPIVHNVTRMTNKLPRSLPTLPEQLYKAGYQTAGVSSNSNVSTFYGFNRGFEYFRGIQNDPIAMSQYVQLFKKISLFRTSLDDLGLLLHASAPTDPLRDVDRVNQIGRRWINNRADGSRPFFLYLHYIEPHGPYNPPRDYLGSMEVPESYNFEKYKKKYMRNDWPYYKIYPFYEQKKPPGTVFEELVYQYDSEIRYWDHHFAKFMKYMKSEGLYENTIFIVSADHGEEFLQHGNWLHGISVYNEQIHVPLIMKFPDTMKYDKGVIREKVSLVDMRSTILEILGIPETSKDHGKSFVPLLTGSDTEAVQNYTSRPIYASDAGGNLNKFYTRISGDLKIHWISNGRQKAWRLYDLSSDFGEQHDIKQRSNRYPELRSELKNWVEKMSAQKIQSTQRDASGRIKKDLKGLGYL